MKQAICTALLSTLGVCAHAQMTPVGAWHSIDDETNKPKAVIRITAAPNGGLSGVVEKALDPDPNADPLCNKCTDDRKGKPKIGMEIIRGGKKSDSKDVWEDGKITDPESGTNYSLRLTPIDGGKKLQVRAYIGSPFLGRSQTWIRVE